MWVVEHTYSGVADIVPLVLVELSCRVLVDPEFGCGTICNPSVLEDTFCKVLDNGIVRATRAGD